MGHLLDLLVEILVIICQHLESLACLPDFSRCCVRLKNVIDYPGNREKIIRLLIFYDVSPLPQNPDQAWVQAHYEPRPMWKASNADLPEQLTHAETRKFLATTGIPSRSLDMTKFDSYLSRFVGYDYEQPDPFPDRRPMLDSDEVFYRANRQGSEEPKFYFKLGNTLKTNLTVDAQHGHVMSEDRWASPAETYQFEVASSVASFLVMMRMSGTIFPRIDWPVIVIGPPESVEARTLRYDALKMLWAVFEDYDHKFTRSFWLRLYEECGESWNEMDATLIP